MVRSLPAGRKIGNVSPEDMESAVMRMLGGNSIPNVSNETGISFSTLRRWVQKAQTTDDPSSLQYQPNYNCRQVFSTEEETMLKEYLLKASKIHHGLSSKQVRKLAFEFAVRNGKEYPDSWKVNQYAGEDWFASFMKRCPELSLRRPEATSLSRATSFNKTNVDTFFSNLRVVLTKKNILSMGHL